MRLLPFADRLVPESDRSDPDALRRARFLLLWSLLGGILCPLFALREWLTFSKPWAAVVLLAVGLAFLGVPYVCRRVSVIAAGSTVGGALAVALFSVAWTHGGIVPTVLMWSALIPLVVSLSGTRRAAYAWTGFVLLGFAVLGLLRTLGVEGVEGDVKDLVTLSAFVVALTFIGRAYESVRERVAIDSAEAQHRVAVQERLESVGHLAAGVAHDFNNLLTIVRGSSRVLLEELGPAHPLAVEVQAIEAAASNGAAIVGRLLAFRANGATETSMFDIGMAVHELDAVLSRLLPEDVSCTMTTAEHLWVKMAPAEVEQILVNLVVNAREAMPCGGKVEVTIARASIGPGAPTSVALPPGDYVVLAVTDTGPGIAPEVLPHIFDPFFTTHAGRGGTGLGLSSVQRMVLRAEGDVVVDTRVGEGTSFRVYLPCLPTPAEFEALEAPSQAGLDPAQLAPAIEPTAPGYAESDGPSGGIVLTPGSAGVALVVDDQPAIARIARRLLQKSGFEVLIARTGSEALELTRANAARIDILLTDVMMPEMDGATLAGEFRRLTNGAPVLYMSGFSNDAEVAREVDTGAAAYLHKPFSPDEFRTAVANALGRDRISKVA